jgi:hypothetical protein
MLEFVDIGPNLCPPSLLVHGKHSASGAACMELAYRARRNRAQGQFNKNASDFLDFILIRDYMFIAKKISESEARRLFLSFGASMERSIFRAQLLD